MTERKKKNSERLAEASTKASAGTWARIPGATYRLQFNRQFDFRQAAALADYLQDLGISDCYASPLFAARPGSSHGYDVTDHSKFNPELGSEEDFIEFARQLKKRGMGLMIDVVPNHMCIAGGGNRWWNDVLENGPSSSFAGFFDIDWQPPKSDLSNKVLLPVLGDQYGLVLENQQIKVSYQRGAFLAHYYETRLPIAPRTYIQLLEGMLPQLKSGLGEYHHDVLELESIITALGHLPPRTESDPVRIKERRREKEIIKRRLATLASSNQAVRRAIKLTLDEINGEKLDRRSFDRLENLLANQAYRLCYWRVAADEINYRRFFDINELAAIRVEEPAVFAAVHDLIFRLIRQGWVTGLRIDHVDGLFDPAQYLLDLQLVSQIALLQSSQKSASGRVPRMTRKRQTGETGKPCYLVVEKILGHGEQLRPDWPIHGTTGYEFLNLLNGIFVETGKAAAFRKVYERFTGEEVEFDDLTYGCKKLILRVAMSSELHVLARKLDSISEQHRYSRDFTLNSLQYALGEVIACFPVYRSYIRNDQDTVGEDDCGYIRTAIRAAKFRNAAISPSIFDFIASILLFEDRDGLSDAQRAERREFVSRFQQLTGPVMAKGLEDTAFYRCYPLASLNEVGSHPEQFGVTLKSFHQQNQKRALFWPHGLSATSTHDTKRSEDARARINVLSEIPGRWYRAIRRWENLNCEKKIRLDDFLVPDANEEYLFYQTLAGVWPLQQMDVKAHAAFVRRIEEYLIKAVREAKLHSSWINPNEVYEKALGDFIRAVLDFGEENEFLKSFAEFQSVVTRAGLFNSLSQLLLKIASPGVPDFYQGTELWNFTLVDPDNRREVDYRHCRALLDSLKKSKSDKTSLIAELIRHPEDGRIKMFLTRQALRFRAANPELFANGSYTPVSAVGEKSSHVIAFARQHSGKSVIVATSRFFTRLGDTGQIPIGQKVWGGTFINPGNGLRGPSGRRYRDVITGKVIDVPQGNSQLPLAEIFAHLPVAMLESLNGI